MRQEQRTKEPDAELDQLARGVIGAAIAVHKELGPGFPESVYAKALEVELRQRRISFEREYPVSVVYQGQLVGEGRADFFVGGRLIVELKAVEKVLNIHLGQVIAYLKMVRQPLGLLLNFHVSKMKEGIHRVVYSPQ